ncbi:ROK family protein [Streptomyces sp. SID5785]|uniref:ROK family transcriptional regulator n=1 Tax=Streptomyces sp. SID5785 TaxID=2690309 RepID=UPI0013612A98|nr:ROK family transcriptional regulator [Streptomyces sp. SID5785]MZD06306.1 ROK family protein [Streptomyces sp. SID5785]
MAGRNGRTVHDLRRANRAALLQQLYFDGPLSRHELGSATGLSSGSVSNVTAELVAEGLAEEAGSVGSDGGRPRTLLRIDPGGGLLIGVDVGENLVRVELFDLVLTELARVEHPLAVRDHYDVDVVVRHVQDGVAEVLAAAGADPERLLGVGVGVPGIVARGEDGGAVVHGQTIGWSAVPLERLLRTGSRLPQSVPYFIDNGAKTLGQAEMWFGAGRGAGSAIVVLFGSGVGACVVTEDGAQARAVEWGHLTVRVRGRRCRCGSRGCLEAYAGAQSLVGRWREATGAPQDGGGEEAALADLLATAYGEAEVPAEDREQAVRILDETAEYLGAGLSDLVNLFQPERILIGGWAGLQLGPRFLEPVREHVAAYALTYPLGRVGLEMGRLGPDAVTVGAATLPLAAFFARGGRRADPLPVPEPAGWRRSLLGRSG